MFPAGFALGKHLVIGPSREIYSNVSLKIMQQLYNVVLHVGVYVCACTYLMGGLSDVAVA